LDGCPTDSWYSYPVCPIIDNNYIWWSGSSWVHTDTLGGGFVFTTLANPGLLPIEILGTYEWTSALIGYATCAPQVINSTLGLCLTPTPTPTPTMTPTPTPTPTQTKQYYVYKLCGDAKVAYVVQTQPGLTTTPGKVIRTTLDEYCWEFLYQTTNQNPIPSSPLVQIVNWDGDYLTPSLGIIFDNCTDCLTYVTPVPPTTYVLLGPYASAQLACVAGNQNGIAGLGFTTFSNNNPAVGSQVYNSLLSGGSQLVTTPGWYSYSASFVGGGIYGTIYIDNTGTITQTGQSCISVIIP